jgi:hypothetical protein
MNPKLFARAFNDIKKQNKTEQEKKKQEQPKEKEEKEATELQHAETHKAPRKPQEEEEGS